MGFIYIDLTFSIQLSENDFEAITNIDMREVTEDDRRIIHKLFAKEVMQDFLEELSSHSIEDSYTGSSEQGTLNVKFKIDYTDVYLSYLIELFEKRIQKEMNRWYVLEIPVYEFSIKASKSL
jgi:hypothetical protein